MHMLEHRERSVAEVAAADWCGSADRQWHGISRVTELHPPRPCRQEYSRRRQQQRQDCRLWISSCHQGQRKFGDYGHAQELFLGLPLDGRVLSSICDAYRVRHCVMRRNNRVWEILTRSSDGTSAALTLQVGCCMGCKSKLIQKTHLSNNFDDGTLSSFCI